MRTRTNETYSTRTILRTHRALWRRVYGATTEARARTLFTVAATTLVWAAGLGKDPKGAQAPLKLLGIELGGSPKPLTYVAIGLLIYVTARWYLSTRRDHELHQNVLVRLRLRLIRSSSEYYGRLQSAFEKTLAHAQDTIGNGNQLGEQLKEIDQRYQPKIRQLESRQEKLLERHRLLRKARPSDPVLDELFAVGNETVNVSEEIDELAAEARGARESARRSFPQLIPSESEDTELVAALEDLRKEGSIKWIDELIAAYRAHAKREKLFEFYLVAVLAIGSLLALVWRLYTMYRV